jgi:hypothetical protein
MTTSLAGWQRRPVEGGVLLVPPPPMLGAVRVCTGRPIRPARDVVQDIVRPGFAGAAFEPAGAARAFTTLEGEHAALFELVARAPAFEVRRAIAIVYGDESCVTLDGRVARPADYDITGRIESMARELSLGLGSDRWRRFFYTPPAGWHRLARFQSDLWLAPDYPRDSGRITVFRARPVEPRTPLAQHAHLFEELTAEYKEAGPLDRQPLQVASGLAGERVSFRATIDGKPRLATNVVLADRRHVHLLRLETDPDHVTDGAQAFGRVVSSVEPIPSPGQKAEAFDQWSE